MAEGSVHWGRNGTGLHLDPLLVDRDTPLPQSASPFRRCTKHKYRYYMVKGVERREQKGTSDASFGRTR